MFATLLERVPFMQLTATHRREVIEDLLDIKIFSSMNNLIKDKIRGVREEIRTLDLKKESLNDKVKMQTDFIEKIEKRGNDDIKDKKKKSRELGDEICVLMLKNEHSEDKVYGLTKEQEKVIGATEKLRKMGTIKGTLSNKVATITKKTKFFEENTVCPTCKQDIEEEFRLNNISDAQDKIK